ncbi:MAG: methionine gamma-lyase [Ectobacillus sp.]
MMKRQIETELIHHAYEAKQYSGSLTPPLFQTSTYTFETAQAGERSFRGEENAYIYSRLGNPTVQILEERAALLEGGAGALAFGSGMAAVSAVLFTLLKAGDHVVCSKGLYGCTYGFLEMIEEKLGITHTLCDMDTVENIVSASCERTKLLFVETPINPTMKMIDLSIVVQAAKQKGWLVVVDNTFCSPYLQTPLQIGCDVVLHSATKYIGGHGDVIGGLVVCKAKDLAERLKPVRKDIGGIMSPFDAWLLLRGLKTLAVRMDRHCDNAEKVAKFLKKHPAVQKVFYPFDIENPDYKIAKRQMKRGGGVIAFTIQGGKQEAQAMMNRLQLVSIAVSLGDTETLIQHPATMTHAVVPVEVREKMGISDNMLRLSVGLEAAEDIIEDLKQALG